MAERALWHVLVVFVAWPEPAAIVELLESRLGRLVASGDADDPILLYENASTSLAIVTHIEGGAFTELEIHGFALPWESSLECARELATIAGRTTRVTPSELTDPQLPVALEIDAAGSERLVEWELAREPE